LLTLGDAESCHVLFLFKRPGIGRINSAVRPSVPRAPVRL